MLIPPRENNKAANVMIALEAVKKKLDLNSKLPLGPGDS